MKPAFSARKSLQLIVAIVFMCSTNMTVIGYSDHCLMLFTNGWHRSEDQSVLRWIRWDTRSSATVCERDLCKHSVKSVNGNAISHSKRQLSCAFPPIVFFFLEKVRGITRGWVVSSPLLNDQLKLIQECPKVKYFFFCKYLNHPANSTGTTPAVKVWEVLR